MLYIFFSLIRFIKSRSSYSYNFNASQSALPFSQAPCTPGTSLASVTGELSQSEPSISVTAVLPTELFIQGCQLNYLFSAGNRIISMYQLDEII